MVFAIDVAVFHGRVKESEEKRTVRGFEQQRFLEMLYTVSGSITVRNVFHVAAFD